MSFVVLDEFNRLLLRRAGQPKYHVDPLEYRGVGATADGLQVHLDLLEPDRCIARAALDQQDAAGGHAGEERVGGRDLFTRTPQVGRLVDHELTVAHVVDRATRRRRARGVNPVHDKLVVGHSYYFPSPACGRFPLSRLRGRVGVGALPWAAPGNVDEAQRRSKCTERSCARKSRRASSTPSSGIPGRRGRRTMPADGSPASSPWRTRTRAGSSGLFGSRTRRATSRTRMLPKPTTATTRCSSSWRTHQSGSTSPMSPFRASRSRNT